MKIVIIAGGWSSERYVSLRGTECIERALEELGHTVSICNPSKDLFSCISLLESSDFVFINIHGVGGEDGLFSALVENLGIPYQCSNAQGSVLALNKAMAKVLYTKHGIPTAPCMLCTEQPKEITLKNYPLFIKANTGGSSLGLYRAENEKEVREAIKAVLSSGDSALIEECVYGVEVSCGVLGEKALPPICIRPKKSIFFDHESKYDAGATEEICPAPLPQEQLNIVMEYAQKAHTILGLFGYSRTDMIIQENGIPIVLETNTIPGMTNTSLFPQEAEAIGISFTQLMEILIQQGLERNKIK